MDEYLRTLLEQIRCKKAHPYIEEEIRGHIEEQMKTNIAMGMTKEEAMEEAVADMGSPVEAGIALDQIHRPKMAWDMILLMGIISVLGMLVHTAMGADVYGSNRFVLHTICGFIVMLLVYRLDYSFIARHGKIIAGMFLLFLFLTTNTALGGVVNGQRYYFSLGSVNFSIFAIMLLYVPVYGAVLYQYYGTGYDGIAKALLWMLVPVVQIFYMPNPSLAVILFTSMAILLSLAVYKNWFKVSKKRVLCTFWGVTILTPTAVLVTGYGMRLFAAYQIERIKAFVTNSGDGAFITGKLRDFLAASNMVGGNGMDVASELPEYNTNFIFNYIVSSYGILAGILLCAVLTFLVIKVYSISLKQKNQLGMIMGCGCGTIILANAALNIFQNTGLLPVTTSFLPFFSYGGNYLIVSYAMMGLILSIYRYKNIYPIRFRKNRIRIRFEKEVM